MTASHFSGPIVTFGFVPGTGGSNTEAGPGASYQGGALLDPRWPYQPGNIGTGAVKGFFNPPAPVLVDAVPAAKSNTLVTPALAAATAIATTPQVMPLQTTNTAGRAVSVPVVPFGKGLSAANVQLAMLLDPGTTVGTAASGSPILTAVADVRLFSPGFWVGIVGGGTAGSFLLARALKVDKVARTITLDRNCANAVAGTPLILMEPVTGISAWPGVNQGAVQLFEPHSAVTRAVCVVAGTGDGGYVVTVSGLDVYLNPMSEQITSVAATTTNGRKAFKYITGVTVARGSGAATVTTSLSVGTTDIIGLNLRNERWEYLATYFAGAPVTSSTGWTAALPFQTPPAQSGAGAADVRGTYALQVPSDGVARLIISAAMPIEQVTDASYTDVTSLFGPAQV